MIYCNKCGSPLPDEAEFCSECGNSLKSAVPISTSATSNANSAPSGAGMPSTSNAGYASTPSIVGSGTDFGASAGSAVPYAVSRKNNFGSVVSKHWKKLLAIVAAIVVIIVAVNVIGGIFNKPGFSSAQDVADYLADTVESNYNKVVSGGSYEDALAEIGYAEYTKLPTDILEKGLSGANLAQSDLKKAIKNNITTYDSTVQTFRDGGKVSINVTVGQQASSSDLDNANKFFGEEGFSCRVVDAYNLGVSVAWSPDNPYSYDYTQFTAVKMDDGRWYVFMSLDDDWLEGGITNPIYIYTWDLFDVDNADYSNTVSWW